MSENAITIEEFSQVARRIESEVRRVIVGQEEVIRSVLICVLAGRHALLEGVPGLGKTQMIRTLADALDLKFSRIQFTPDLMPADIIGTDILEEGENGKRAFVFQPGPIFANLLLADEINRATPKTQSALLEAMQEQTVTVAGRVYPLSPPFFVLATQNPLEMEGTYPLPEAQLETPIATHIREFVARLIVATHPESPSAPELVRRYVRYGSSPRGAQALIIGAKLNALLDGRFNVAFEDVQAVALPALRHRVLLNFEAQADDVTPDMLLTDLLSVVQQRA
jgi:MoxR-like ATPase